MKGQRPRSRTGTPCPTPDKDRHRTEDMAQRTLAHLQAKFGDEGIRRLHTYLCPCGYWHLGRRAR